MVARSKCFSLKLKKHKNKIKTMSFLSFVAAIQQPGTDAPISRIYSNEINAQEWTKSGVGRYQFLCDAFPLDKAWVGGFSDFWGSASPYLPIMDGATIVGYYTIWPNNAFVSEQLSGFTVGFLNTAGESAELSEIAGTSTFYLPEMRIYL